MHSSDSLLGIEWLRNEILKVLCVPGNVGQMWISTRDLSSNFTWTTLEKRRETQVFH